MTSRKPLAKLVLTGGVTNVDWYDEGHYELSLDDKDESLDVRIGNWLEDAGHMSSSHSPDQRVTVRVTVEVLTVDEGYHERKRRAQKAAERAARRSFRQQHGYWPEEHNKKMRQLGDQMQREGVL